MAEPYGPANQSGISYQNLIAARFVAEILCDVELPPSRRIISVQSEAREHVDDVVVTYADGHRAFLQSKENLSPTSDAWRGVWSDFVLQFGQPTFRRNPPERQPDTLYLWMDADQQDMAQWGEALRRTRSAHDFDEWFGALNEAQRTFWRTRVAPLLTALAPDEQWQLLRHVRCQIRTRETLEAEALRLLPAAFNKNGQISPTNLFSHVLSRLPDDAAWRVTLEPQELRAWLHETHDVRLERAPNLTVLQEAIWKCSAVLRAQRHRFGAKGQEEQRHLPRPVSRKILDWLLAGASVPEEAMDGSFTSVDDGVAQVVEDNVAVLLEGAGRGKTVVLRDVLSGLEGRGIPTLAIKADRQLGDLAAGRAIHECNGVRLPAPVEDVVGWVARAQNPGQPVVVLLDQVDALSLTMARDEYAIEAVSTLVARLRRMPGVRVLLACRTFDLNTTPALRSLDVKQKFELPKLEESEVAQVLRDANIEASLLSSPTLELLRVPLHLDLFLRAVEGEDSLQAATPVVGDARAVRSLQDLYALLWKRIVVSPESPIPPGDRVECVRALVNAMTQAHRTVAPDSLFQAVGRDSLEKAAGFLEHEGLLVKEAGGWSFLHQTFFDYAFARFFVQEKRSLSQTVFNSPQGLDERPLLAHVLGFLRATAPVSYNAELVQLGIGTFFDLPNERLRKHLRRLLREWFGTLREPSDIEWRHARRLLQDPVRRVEFLNEACNNSDWFALLLPQYLPRWLQLLDQGASDDQALIALENAMFWMFRSLCNDPEPQSQILALLQPFAGLSERWNQRLKYFVSYVNKWHSSEIVALYGDTLIANWDGDGMRHSYQLRGVAKQRPLDACAVLRRALDLIDQKIQNAPPSGTRRSYLSNIFSEALDTRTGGFKIDHEVLDPIAEEVPVAFLEAVWPFFKDVMTRGLAEDDDNTGPYFSTDACHSIWQIRTSRGSLHSSHFGIDLASALGKALQKLAQEQPDEFDKWWPLFASLKAETPQRLVCDGFRSNPERYALATLEFLLGDERRLELGEQAFETRRLIEDMKPFWSDDQCQLVEANILDHVVFQENGDWPKGVGYEQWRLLRALGKERLSSAGMERLNEKFGDQDLPQVPITSQGGFIGSPISPNEAETFSDAQWLEAMSHYQGPVEHPDFLKGGAYQLGHVLEEFVKSQPERFARLFLERVPLDVDACYVKAALRGLAGSVAPSESLFDLVRKFMAHCGPDLYGDFSIDVARALGDRAHDGLPDDLLELMLGWVKGPAPIGDDESFHARQQEEQSQGAKEEDTDGS